jgi:hypothetical protein
MVAKEMIHTELANIGENLLFPEICIEGLSQQPLMFSTKNISVLRSIL